MLNLSFMKLSTFSLELINSVNFKAFKILKWGSELMTNTEQELDLCEEAGGVQEQI